MSQRRGSLSLTLFSYICWFLLFVFPSFSSAKLRIYTWNNEPQYNFLDTNKGFTIDTEGKTIDKEVEISNDQLLYNYRKEKMIMYIYMGPLFLHNHFISSFFNAAYVDNVNNLLVFPEYEEVYQEDVHIQTTKFDLSDMKTINSFRKLSSFASISQLTAVDYGSGLAFGITTSRFIQRMIDRLYFRKNN